MLYLMLNLVFMLIAFVIVNAFARKTPWPLVFRTMAAMSVVTLVFDNIIIGLGIVDYDVSKLSGIYLGFAPIEDFAYTVVSVITVASIWFKVSGREK
ncbi:MAG: lycopene cyclase domain-containing protein [Microbacteriaceae bacterium]|nr:lycopene cyclase domain-containing protein [Microbacteriaceae bacterium]NBS62579.1 lycopene cyclase domain-containing protein [Microbacteriaceae bacterium]